MSEGNLSEQASVFTALSGMIYAGSSFDEVFEATARAAVDLIPGCDHASVSTLVAGGKLACRGVTDEVARLLDHLENTSGEGPCLDAILDNSFQHDSDITNGTPWPRLAQLVLTTSPVRGMIGYRLIADGRKAGALNVFSDTPGALTKESADMGAIIAAFASVAMSAAVHHAQAQTLRQGLESNREIGKAIGLLMATHRLTDAQAFDVLHRASSQMNVRLADLARRTVAGHHEGL